MTQAVAAVVDAVASLPRLRGWLHAATAPLALVAGAALVAGSPEGAPRIGSLVFAASALVLFTVSATMHRGHWSPAVNVVLTRLDHASIFLLIAGTYTPVALLMLDGAQRDWLLGLVWAGAGVGIAFRLLCPHAPRWVYTPVYLALGWAAVPFIPDLLRHGNAAVLVLIAAGGLLYTVGGVVYGLRRPNPIPAWFEFHEVFHALTVLAFAAHFAGITLAVQSLR